MKFLTETIKASGGTPVDAVKYDFTAKGTFPTVFSDYKTFLTVAQGFEDTGVRAYNRQATKLTGFNDILQAALQIIPVEARHDAHIRYARRVKGFNMIVTPWIVVMIIPKARLLRLFSKEKTNIPRFSSTLIPLLI